MRILRISLRNIASLEGPQTVDFTRDPLRAAGLFSISGITGSGKSTLLDALCLALYERTPRLNAVRGTVKLADGGDSISQKDPANLLRRGTGEGFAEVAFVGVDNATYTARWTVRRARSRPDGSLQNTEMTLFRGNVPPGTNGAIEQGGKKTEVLPVIAAKVGLSFEQFTRAVLLAQNDFAAFLKADDKERAEILQALTGTERFEAISVAVFNRCSDEQRAVAGLEGRLTGNAPLTPEARLEAESTCATADGAWNEANAKLNQCEAHAAWFQRLRELAQLAGDAETLLREKAAARDSAAPRRIALSHTEEASRDARPLRDSEHRIRAETAEAEKARADAAKAEETARTDHAEKKLRHASAEVDRAAAKTALENAKPFLLQARDLDAKLPPLAERLTAATRDRESAEVNAKLATSSRDTLRDKRDTAEKERAPLTGKRDALVRYAAFAPDATAWLDRIDRAIECRNSLRDAAGKLALRAKEEKTKTDTASAERVKEAAARSTAEAAKAAFEQAEKSARAHDGEKIVRARKDADAARTALRDLETQLQEFDSLSAQATSLDADIAKLKIENEADGKTLADLKEKRIPEAEKALEAARRAFDIAEAAVTEDAVRLREKLAPGHPCPVCGAKEHPHAEHPPSSEAAALRALRADCSKKQDEARLLRENAAGLNAARTERHSHEVEKSKTLTALKTRLATVRCFRDEHPAAAAIVALQHTERAAALATQLAAQQQTLAALESADAARREAEKTRDELRSKRDSAIASLEGLQKQLAKFDEEIAALRAAHEAAVSTHANAEKEFRSALNELAPLFDGLGDTRTAWDSDATVFRNQFAEEAAAFVELEKRLGQLTGTIREVEAALAPANEALIRAESEAVAKRSAEAGARAACDAVRSQRAALFNGRSADIVENELSAAQQRALEMRDLRAVELGKAQNQLTAIAESLRGADKILADSTSRQTTAMAALDSWIAGFKMRIGHAFDRTDLETMLGWDEMWLTTERDALNAMDGAIRSAEGALTVHKKSLDDHTASRPTADDEPTVTAALATLHTLRTEAEQRRDTARAFLLADDQRIKANVEFARQLGERRTIAEPWIKLNELIGSADGAKFRGIAQRRTLDILIGYANAQLDLLAARYRLERLPESLNLIVIDRDMGDERRSVHSLSGGESFLVSLALALALASLTSNRLRIESLFIDEGFGSLDPETLNTAMNALMHLEAQGRKVGVISHVSEMTDAIPVQIRVVKGRSGASRLIVPGAPEATDIPVASCSVGEDGPNPNEPTRTIHEIAAQIVTILRRELASGHTKVSVRSLREEIGCSLSDFTAAREAVIAEVRGEGKSLTLA